MINKIEHQPHGIVASAGSLPKILIISKNQINEIDSMGASLRNWFKEWPREHLAQIFSGSPWSGSNFCQYNYQLTGRDRRFGSLFDKLKQSSKEVITILPTIDSLKNRGRSSDIRKAVKTFIDSGLWEVVFPPKISPGLDGWVSDFKPDVMFVQGGDISFMLIALAIHAAYSIPICLHTNDDWPGTLYRNTPFSSIMYPRVDKTFRNLLDASVLRLTIGDLMGTVFNSRYGKEFIPLMICDDIERFTEAEPVPSTEEEVRSIVYSGSLGLKRWKSLADIGSVAEELTREGLRLRVVAYVPSVPEEAKEVLSQNPYIDIHGPLHDREVPSVFKGADVLFLPESFDPEFRTYIRLSVSTKSHLYMMSGRPILVYGPPEVGVVDYARRDGWAYVVDEDDRTQLKDGIKRLLTDESIRCVHLDNARRTLKKNHDGTIVRERFRSLLWGAVQ